MSSERRPPAGADRGRAGPFAALLERVGHDAEAAGGLALGYAELDCADRRRLIDAILMDARAQGLEVGRVLVPLLAVEGDADLARVLAEAIRTHGNFGAVQDQTGEAWLTGHEEAGQAVLVRPLHNPFAEAIGVVWEGPRLVRSRYEPMIRRDQVAVALGSVLDMEQLRPVAVRDAVDALAAALWRHLRAGGRPPPGIGRFSDMLAP